MHAPWRRYAALSVVTALLAIVLLSSSCSRPANDPWTPVSGLSGTAPIVSLTAVGDRLLAGTQTGDGVGAPGLTVLSGSSWTDLPVTPATPYGREARWLSVVAAADGALVAIGGARGGAHSNVRYTAWKGSVAAGLTEQEQTFGTFGGWGAGEQVGPVLTPSGPMLIGSWESAKSGLDIDVWLPQGERWIRQSSAGTALESTPTEMTGARSVTSLGAGALVSGSVIRLGNGEVRKLPAVWRSASGNSGWSRIDLPEAGRAGEAVAGTCAAESCTIVGWVDGKLPVWRLDASGARRLDGVPTVSVTDADELAAPVLVDGLAVLLVTDHDSPGTAALLREGSRGWSREPGPGGSVAAFTAVGAALYAVTRLGGSSPQLWSHPR